MPLCRFVPAMEFKNILINWYEQNKRQLPWRNTSDPYIVWVSEIILQQTRVDQGLGYFKRFVARFPNVFSLARASEQEVLKHWQGLGYYTRARNMQVAARTIVKEFNGIFPQSSGELLKLKGIGPYTASAIASICYGEACPVVDGNVMRVIARYFGIKLAVNTPEGYKAVYEAALQVIDRERAGAFNQAIMEFGALHCTPRKPLCDSCLLQSGCEAFRAHLVDSLPVKIKLAKPRERHFYYLAIFQKNEFGHQEIFIQKRKGKDIWKGMYELPLIESPSAIESEELFRSRGWITIFGEQQLQIIEYSDIYKHQLTHQTIYARFISVYIEEPLVGSSDWQRIEVGHLPEFPIPRLIDRFLKLKKIIL